MGALNKDEIISGIETMTVLELSDLVKALEEKFGVSAAAMAPMAALPAADDAAEKKEEQTEFSVVLTAAGNKKIQVIKEVRSITGLGLKEAKAVVDEAPKAIKEGISKEEAESLMAKLTEAGASVEIK